MAFKMKAKGFGNSPMKKNFPSAFKQTDDDDKLVKYSDLPEDQRAAARKYNMDTYGTHNPSRYAKTVGVTKDMLKEARAKTKKDSTPSEKKDSTPSNNIGLADVGKARKRAPQRYTGLSDDKIVEILRKDAKRTARRAAKIKKMRDSGRNPNKT